MISQGGRGSILGILGYSDTHSSIPGWSVKGGGGHGIVSSESWDTLTHTAVSQDGQSRENSILRNLVFLTGIF